MAGARVEMPMMQTVQLSIADAVYATAVREALARTGPWQVESVEHADLTQRCVLVLDEAAFHSLPLPVNNPERVVLVTRKDPQLLAQAWDAGIVSVVSDDDPINTVLLAIMAAALRVAKPHAVTPPASGISPNPPAVSAPLPPQNRPPSHKRCKTP
jgi:hypothetical protein